MAFIQFHSRTGAQITECAWHDPEIVALNLADAAQWVWLDSSTGDRFSYLCRDPIVSHQIDDLGHDDAERRDRARPHWDGLAQELEDDPFPDLPSTLILPPFRGGFVVLLSYEAGGLFDAAPQSAPYQIGDQTLPPLIASLYSSVLAYDHETHRCFIIATGSTPRTSPKTPEKTPQLERAERAAGEIDQWCVIIDHLSSTAHQPMRFDEQINLPPLDDLSSDFSCPAFQAAVQKTIEYIHEGDIFQANLSQEFSGRFSGDISGLDLYRKLRHKSPAPFSVFAQFPSWTLISASPEQFLSIHQGVVQSRPIKGTAPRDPDPDRDAEIALQLTLSAKDRAENIMIVDLLRNDLARVCRDHSIEVSDLCALESHSNVHHLVSTISGTLSSGRSALDVIAASFPGGSITGAPKIRAMEIISEIEKRPRGPYCGSFGYIGFDGSTMLNILIRSIVKTGRHIKFAVGGGMTARSCPAQEYQETLDKAAHIADTLGVVLSASGRLEATYFPLHSSSHSPSYRSSNSRTETTKGVVG